MAKYNFKAPTENQRVQKTSNDTGEHDCHAFGCPRLATIKTEYWNCRYHNLRSGESLDHITMLLKNHEREINWLEKVINMPYHEFEHCNAPVGMEAAQGESLPDYRRRMSKQINDLLKNPKNKPPIKYNHAEYATNECESI